MWQHHYLIHSMKMEALRAEAERERRWRLADAEAGRPDRSSVPGLARGAAARLAAAVARFAAAVARFADRAARRLDERTAVGLGSDRAVRDAGQISRG